MRKPRTTKACKFCGLQIDEGCLNRHEKLCAKLTDSQREAAAKRRLKYHRYAHTTPATRSNGHIRVNGRRVHVSLSCDFNTIRELLLNLAPSLSIDKVELV